MESQEERRKGEWSLFKEVTGTFIGVAPFIIGIVVWGFGLQERVRVSELKLEYEAAIVKKIEESAKDQRLEILNRLDRIASQVETLQQLVASSRVK